jgi:O-antigen ligase
VVQLATLLCAAFILFAFRRDARERRAPSPALWIPFVWFALSVSKPITYWLYPGQFVAFSQRLAFQQQRFELVQNNPHERILLTALIVLGLIALSRRWGKLVLRVKDNLWLSVFFLYGLVSVSWADYQGVAAKRWIRGAGDLLMVLLIVSDADPEAALDRILRRCAILLIPLSLLFAKFYPQMGRIYTVFGRQMWVGVTGHKNQLGLLCAFCGIFLVWRMLKKWPSVDVLDGALIAVTMYLLIKANSQASMVVFLLGGIILLIQRRAKTDARKLARMLIASLVALFLLQGVMIAVLNQSLSTVFFTAANRDVSLTGRVPLWKELVATGARRPLFGAGYSGFWSGDSVPDVWRKVGWTPTTGHNGYIDIFLDLGIAGLLIVLFFLIHTQKAIMASYGSHVNFARLKFCFFVMVLFHNFAESSLGKANSLLWLLLMLSSLVYIRKAPDASAEPPRPGDPELTP